MTPQQVKTLLRSYNRLEVTASIQRQRAASLRAEAKAVGVPTISRIDAGGSGHSNTSPVERAAHEIERQKAALDLALAALLPLDREIIQRHLINRQTMIFVAAAVFLSDRSCRTHMQTGLKQTAAMLG